METFTYAEVLELLAEVVNGPAAARCMDDEEDREALIADMADALQRASEHKSNL